MPSTMSSSVSKPLASSIVIAPSRPTLSIAAASMRPICSSPLAETVPTCAISSEVVTGLEHRLSSLTTAAVARSIPRFRSIGFMPATTAFAPSEAIAEASTVAVVVPSPASSLALFATSLMSWTPRFSMRLEASISLATVTPSLVTRGAPKLLSRSTLRPLGPSVTRTASAIRPTPLSIRSRASVEKRRSLADMVVLSRSPADHLLRNWPAANLNLFQSSNGPASLPDLAPGEASHSCILPDCKCNRNVFNHRSCNLRGNAGNDNSHP